MTDSDYTGLDPMGWAREYGCTFSGCESKDVWVYVTPTLAAVEQGADPGAVAILCRTHTQLFADENHGGENYPVELIQFVKIGSKRGS